LDKTYDNLFTDNHGVIKRKSNSRFGKWIWNTVWENMKNRVDVILVSSRLGNSWKYWLSHDYRSHADIISLDRALSEISSGGSHHLEKDTLAPAYKVRDSLRWSDCKLLYFSFSFSFSTPSLGNILYMRARNERERTWIEWMRLFLKKGYPHSSNARFRDIIGLEISVVTRMYCTYTEKKNT